MPSHRATIVPPLTKGVDGSLFGPDGYDGSGHDRHGFNRAGLHRDTKTRLSPDGYDQAGRRAVVPTRLPR